MIQNRIVAFKRYRTRREPLRVLASVLLMTAAAEGSAALYTGNGPGHSTIGVGGDYPTLLAASQAISNAPLVGGDWTFLIQGDLTETDNTTIGPPTPSAHSIIFRPAPGTQPVITYAHLTPNYSYPAHFMIGQRSVPLGSPNKVRPAHNIVIDGSNEPGTDRRDLTFTNANLTTSLGMFMVYGDSDNVTIKNCNIHSYATAAGSYFKQDVDFTICFYPHTNFNSPTPNWVYSDNSAIFNCDIKTTGSVRYAISCNYVDYMIDNILSDQINRLGVGVTIANNSIAVTGGGIGCDLISQVDVSSNTLDLVPSISETEPETDDFTAGVTLACSADLLVNTNLYANGNTIRYHQAVGGTPVEFFVRGIAMRAGVNPLPVTYQVHNNFISSDSYDMDLGIQYRGASFDGMDIAHNSIAFPEDPGTTPNQYPSCSGIEISASQSVVPATIRNNIIYAASPRVVCLKHYGGTGDGLELDYNNYYTANGGAVLYDWSTHYTLAQWQAASGKDQHSISQNPFAPAEAGAGTWFGPAGTANPNMRFTSPPGTVYHAPRLADVLTDIDGNPRPENATVMGAHQPLDTSSIGAWALY